jgi:hypothetical protein
MAAPDTSLYPPMPGTAERPGLDEHEHPHAPGSWGAWGAGADSVVAYLRDVQQVIIEANRREIIAAESQDPPA